MTDTTTTKGEVYAYPGKIDPNVLRGLSTNELGQALHARVNATRLTNEERMLYVDLINEVDRRLVERRSHILTEVRPPQLLRSPDCERPNDPDRQEEVWYVAVCTEPALDGNRFGTEFAFYSEETAKGGVKALEDLLSRPGLTVTIEEPAS